MAYEIDTDTLPQFLRDFASYKSMIQGCSEKTVGEYLLDLRTFLRYMISVKNNLPLDYEKMSEVDISNVEVDFLGSIKTDDIYEFFLFLSNYRKNSASAKSRKLSAIKALYKYLTQKRHLLEVNPAADIESPKKKQQLPKYLSLDESINLLNAIQADENSKSKERDFAIVTLFLNCGMRLSELVGISLNDLDKELRSLRVMGKGSKERIIYLNDACRSALSDYLKIRLNEQNLKLKDNALFISRQNKRISVKTVQWLVYKYLGEAGLEYKHYSTHKLRHTAATLMYQTGEVDVRVLKEILGHEQLNTTQIYTHVSNEGMENAINKNPLANIGKRKKKDNDTEINE